MAPRRAADDAQESQLGGLAFNEPLSWRAGKAIPTGELLRRLDSLAAELRDMEQEDTDKDSLTHVAKQLAGQNLLGHKDKGVRAFTACCLVDILRICAPDAPFTATMLKVRKPAHPTQAGTNLQLRISSLYLLPQFSPPSPIPRTPTIRSISTSWSLSPKSKASSCLPTFQTRKPYYTTCSAPFST